jgi:hypothetical protein
MKNSLRLMLLVAVVVAIGTAFSGSASAAFDPSKGPFLTVEQTSYKVGAATTVDFVLSTDTSNDQSNDATAKATIFSPAGYGSTLGHAPGTVLGKAFAVVKAGALGGALLPLSGDVVVGNPSDPALMAASTQCTGQAAPAGQEIWVLNTQLQGQAVQVPAFVNKVGPYLTQQICLPDPPHATFQAKLIVADYYVKGVFTNAGTRGGYQWDGIFTPYTNGALPANPAGTVEYRSYSGLPSSLTLKRVKLKKKSVVTFSGKLSVAGLNPAGIRIGLYSGAKVLPAPGAIVAGTGKRVVRSKPIKNSKGSFTFVRRKVKKRTFFQARFENYGVQGACDGPSPSGQPIPCTGTDLAPLTSKQIRVNPPPKKKKKHK